MDELKRKLVTTVADVVDILQFGKQHQAWGPERNPFRLPVKLTNISEQLTRLNDALGAGRMLGILPEELAKFSTSEKSFLIKELRSYHAIGAIKNVRVRLLGLLRERGFPEELLGEIALDTDRIKTEFDAEILPDRH